MENSCYAREFLTPQLGWIDVCTEAFVFLDYFDVFLCGLHIDI